MKLLQFFLALLATTALTETAAARPNRPALLPNGSIVGCASCHVSPGGGGTRTPFGARVNTLISQAGTDAGLWNAALAVLDSDGDGRTNGQELNDPEGDFTTTGTTGVTNPGNRPPVFTSIPPTTATRGITLSYTAAATDQENNARTYAKETGPAWLTVSTAGVVSGRPPIDAPATIPVGIRVTDSGTTSTGFSRGFTLQNFTLAVRSSFTGWQSLTFTLPGEATLSTSSADPDGDGMTNLEEYARATSPKVPTPSPGLAAPTGSAPWNFTVQVRDDDPALRVVLHSSPSLPFVSPTVITPITSDPTPGDGLITLTMTDPGDPMADRRFWRVVYSLAP